MADFKLITIIGIHAAESYPRADQAEEAWATAVADPAFVAAALFQGGHTAPLSGQSFSLVRVAHHRKAP